MDTIKSLFENFDGLVFSAPLGIVKPSKDIFEHLLNTYSLKAEESVFIDDTAKNIDCADKIGISTYLFDGDSQKLSEYLRNKK